MTGQRVMLKNQLKIVIVAYPFSQHGISISPIFTLVIGIHYDHHGS
jgi:hypothetical protein